MLCDGRELSVAEYPALFGSLGGQPEEAQADQTFELPDYQGLTASLYDSGPSLFSVWALRMEDSVEEYGPDVQMIDTPLRFVIKTKNTVFRMKSDGSREVVEDKR